MRDVCVIGLGLIGGSLVRAASAAGRTVWGATASQATAQAARDDGFDVTGVPEALKRAAESDALVVPAVPMTALPGVLKAIVEHAPKCLVTDVTSVKGPVAAMAERAGITRFVGGHPMAGTAESGWPASDAGLFEGAAWAVCLEYDTAIDDWVAVTRLALDVGAHVVPVTSAMHDAAVARISHLPHLLAAVLAAIGADAGPLALSLAAGSFGDGIRVAGSRPELVQAMTEGNATALLPALDDALGRLGAARGALASTGGLKATIVAGHDAVLEHSRLSTSDGEEGVIDVTAPGADEALLELGENGGRIIAMDRHRATTRTP